jgi:outer membrane protein TolC
MIRTLATVSLLTIIISASSALAEEAQISLTLKDAVKMALEKNLDLKAELYNPAQAEADIRKNRAIYETHLTLNTSYQDSTTLPTSTVASGSVSTYEQKLYKLNPGVNRLIPTGGTVGLTFNNSYTDTNSRSTFAMKEYWQSDLSLTFNQPLLKNFGRETTELSIRVAELSKESSLKSLMAKILDTVAKVRSAYYTLYSYRQDLESKRMSLELAKKILSETEARVKAGVLPAMEILNAQFGVSSREKDLIDAERTVSDQADSLRLLLQMADSRDIVPTDPPDRNELKINENEAVNKALATRPDIDLLKSQLETNELQTRVARSQTLPSLNLTSGVALTGLGQSYRRDVERVGSADYPVWNVGIQFDYPLGNDAAENDYIRSNLKTEQTRTQIEGLRSSAATEVRSAIRAVQSGWKQLDVADRGRAYADERLKAYLKKSEVGLATTKDVLDVENDLSTARSNQIKAQVGYTTAISELWRTTGELLEREGIIVDASLSDALYKKAR